MKKHYVDFFSPGTLVGEVTTREVPSWDVDLAVSEARRVTERHGATPYGFQFFTRERGDDDFEPRETARSGTYYLGGRIRTLAEVEADNLPGEEILRWNMRNNGFDRVVENDNSWSVTMPLREGDAVLPFEKG